MSDEIVRKQEIADAGMTDAEQSLLTEARTERWKLESYEFAYDCAVRSLDRKKTVLDFLGILIAIVFLFLQYLFKEVTFFHTVLTYLGTGLSLAVILMVIWGLISRWTDQIEKKRDLSRAIRGLIQEHERVRTIRPVDERKIRKWLQDCVAFHESRKHVLAELPAYCMKLGFQHVGNSYPNDKVTCAVCGKIWTTNSNRRARWTWLPWFGCKNCGV
jgi:mobilome CxxCx(11)CxxC protein